MQPMLELKRRLRRARVTLARYLQDREAPPQHRIQDLFCEWNAERLGISVEKSRERYTRSWRAISYGHRSPRFRAASEEWQQVLSVFSDDSEREVWDAYRMHAPMHFLGMLAKPDPVWGPEHVVIKALQARPSITIVDFGCGLASASRSLALAVPGASLVLVDIPTIRKEFLLWLGRRLELPTRFLDATREAPIPALPATDVVVATEFFEHVYDPLTYLDAFDLALRPNGFLITNVADHEHEFMHVTPDLSMLREELARRRYEEVIPNVTYRKPG